MDAADEGGRPSSVSAVTLYGILGRLIIKSDCEELSCCYGLIWCKKKRRRARRGSGDSASSDSSGDPPAADPPPAGPVP